MRKHTRVVLLVTTLSDGSWPPNTDTFRCGGIISDDVQRQNGTRRDSTQEQRRNTSNQMPPPMEAEPGTMNAEDCPPGQCPWQVDTLQCDGRSCARVQSLSLFCSSRLSWLTRTTTGSVEGRFWRNTSSWLRLTAWPKPDTSPSGLVGQTQASGAVYFPFYPYHSNWFWFLTPQFNPVSYSKGFCIN